jgi:hypothetical protein
MKTIQFVKANAAGSIKEIEFEGKPHLVVPVTMLVEGVHSGNNGPLYYPKEEIENSSILWNGRPVVINHPTKDGVSISANSPDVLETIKVGTIFNTHVNEEGGLNADLYLNKESLESIAAGVLKNIQSKNSIEVSTGLFTDNDSIQGQWKGESYEEIVKNFKPDHLAILPDGVGACSLEDGCGIRFNNNNKMKGGKNVEKLNSNDIKPEGMETLEAMKLLNSVGFTFVQNKAKMDIPGFKAKTDKMREHIYSMDTQNTYHYLEEMYDDAVIYEMRDRNMGQAKLMKQNYTTKDDGMVELTGEPTEVVKKVDVSYTPKQPITMKRGDKLNKKEDQMPDKNCGQCMEKIVTIINSNATPYTEAHREFLLLQDEAFLDSIMPKKEETPAPVTVTNEQILNAMSVQQKEALAYGEHQLAENRKQMISSIQANAGKETWSDEVLNAMDRTMLERLYTTLNKKVDEKVDYTLNGGFTSNNFSTNMDEEPLYPTGVEIESK